MKKIKLKKTTVPNGYSWTIEYTNDVTLFDPSTLHLHLEPEQENGYIKGEVLAERMKEKGLSANVLDYLLANPKLIPEKWKEKWVYFFGTVYRDSGGDLYVRCLCWGDDAWRWSNGWLGRGWSVGGPSAVSASPLKLVTQTSLDPLTLESRVKSLESDMEKIKNLFK